MVNSIDYHSSLVNYFSRHLVLNNMAFRNDILKELRIEKSLTHKQLAEHIGYSKAIIGFWENGEKQPTAEAIIALAKFFKVPSDYLLGLEN